MKYISITLQYMRFAIVPKITSTCRLTSRKKIINEVMAV